MQTQLAIQLSETTFSALSNEAAVVGTTPSELAAKVVEAAYTSERAQVGNATEARMQFEQLFGSVDLGQAIGIDNEQIDASLAREYQTRAE